MKIALIAVVSSLLAGCASSGLYNMSDEWCAAHVTASEARCPKDLKRVAHNDGQPPVSSESRRDD